MRRKVLAFFVITTVLLSFLPAFLPASVYAGSVIISADKDTYIEHQTLWLDSNHGSENNLRAGYYVIIAPPGGTITDRTLIEFPIFQGNPIPTGATITSAYLQLYYWGYDGYDPAGDVILAQRLLHPSWVESVAGWDYYAYVTPWSAAGASQLGLDYTHTSESATTVPSSYDWMNWDITAQVQWAWSNTQNVQLRIVDSIESGSKTIKFRSREYSDAAKRPRLIVNYTLLTAPTVTTTGADTITDNSATCRGYIVSPGSSTVTRRGIKYGLTQTDTWDSYETGSFGVGAFSRDLSSLSSNTTYWFRAYAVNSKGTGYGIWQSFATVAGIPIVTTDHAFIDSCSCNTTLYGIIVSIGDSAVSERGFEWGLNQSSPTKTFEAGSFDVGNYTGQVSVSSNLTYWFRAYAENSQGTGYGIWKQFVATCGGGGGVPPEGGCIAIYDVNDLQAMSNNLSGCYYLANDIDASDTVNWNGGDGFEPVGRDENTFTGTFDGVGHVINGLFINRPNEDYVGLFGFGGGAIIQNVGLTSVDITGHDWVGGIVGYLYWGDITQSYSTGLVTGNNYVGGLVGTHDWGMSISNSYSRANVTGNNAIGGLIGRNNGDVTYTYATGGVTGVTNVGGLIGSSSGGVDYNFWDTQTSGTETSDGGTGKNTTEMKSIFTYGDVGWDIEGTSYYLNDGYPFLSWQVGEGSTWYIPLEEGKCSLTVLHSDGGIVTSPGEGVFVYNCSTIVDLAAEADEGNYFAIWYGDVSTIGDIHNASTNITVDGCYTIYATFIPEGLYYLAIYSTDGGSVVDPGEGVFAWYPDDVVNLEAVAEGLYSFDEWTGDVSTIDDTNNATTTITMLDSYIITANFSSSVVPPGMVSLTISSTDCGNVTAPGEGVFYYELTTVVTLVAEADEGCRFALWTGNVFAIVDAHNLTTSITMGGNYSIVANFVPEGQFALAVSSSDGGDVTDPGEGLFVYDPEEVVNLVAAADENYSFVLWFGDTSTIDDIHNATTTITMEGDYSITATFTMEGMFVLAISCTSGGSVTDPGEGVFFYPAGITVNLAAVSDEGYWFSKWTGDISSVVNPLSSITTIGMYSDCAITANFVLEEEPPEGAPTVVTGNAAPITMIGASLHGTLADMGAYTPVYVFLQYGLTASHGTNTPLQTKVSIGNFSATASGLSPNTTYHYRAVGKYDTNLYVYGDDKTFNTTSAEVEPEGYEYYNCEDIWMYEAYQTGDNETAVIYGADWFFETFTPVQAFKINSVRIKIFRVGSPGVLTVSVRNVNESGEPTGPDLTSASYSGTGPSVGWYEISLPEYRLETKTYALAVRAVGGDAGNYVGWQYDSTGNYTGGEWGASSNSGVSWALDTDKDFLFETYGTTVLCILDAKVFSNFLKSGDWLIAVHYLNEFPPYYSNGDDVTNLFNLQLMSDSIVVARIRVPMWGFMPASIYISPELASTLEWGRNYKVVMKGRFSPYPMATWTLTPEDWLGSDLTRLDTWVLGVADKMTQYYETNMTIYTENKKVLNDEGGVFFSIGIPMLANVRPNLFLNPGLWTSYSEEEWRQTYEDEMTLWRNTFGPKITEDANTVGVLFNLQGNQVGTAIFIGTWVVIGVGVGAVAGAAVLIASIPFLIIGLLGGLIPKPLAAILASVFLLVFVLYTWFNRG